jgi:HK97 family phage major capsid protein
LPALGARGDLVLIDPGYYIIGDRGPNPGGDLEVSVSDVPSFLKNQPTLRVVKRVDGQPWLNGPITLADAATHASPFVVLN